MPPRYAYWTILIGSEATSFRARDREELLPTLGQLQRKHPEAIMKWFAHGQLWDSPEQQQWAQKNKKHLTEKRNAEWRPGGAHKDPRAKFRKRKGPRPPGRPGPPRPRKPKPDGR